MGLRFLTSRWEHTRAHSAALIMVETSEAFHPRTIEFRRWISRRRRRAASAGAVVGMLAVEDTVVEGTG